MDKSEVTFKIGEIDIDNDYFAYLSEEDKADIKEDKERGLTHSVLVLIQGQETFGAFIDVTPNFSIHVREVGGNFPKYIEFLEVYCHALGRFYNAKDITICARREGVEFIAKRLGFVLENTTNEFYKGVNYGR